MNKLNYYKHQFVPLDRTLELYFVGCKHNCKNCQNKFLQDVSPENSNFKSPDEIIEELFYYSNISKQVHILGGEPYDQDKTALQNLFSLLKQYGFKNIIFFTGYELSNKEIVENDLFKDIDYVKVGKYDETNLNTEKEKDVFTGIVLASKNQKIYKLGE